MAKIKHRFLLWGAAVLLTITALTVAAIWGISKVPELSEQVPPNQIPLAVQILSPDKKSSWPADAFIPILVSILTEQDLQSLELWVDGSLRESAPAELLSQSSNAHIFRWLPVTTGNHRLYIRAFDQDGRSAVSNILDLSVIDPSGFGIVPAGSTPSESMELAGIIPAGLEDNIPPSSAETAPETGGLPPANRAPSNFSIWLEMIFSPGGTLPASPELSASTDGCEVNLYIKDLADNELGYFVYRSDPGSTAFYRAATLGVIPQGSTYSYSEPNQKGPQDYYVASFNLTGESPSNPVQVNFSEPDCQANFRASDQVGPPELVVPEGVNLAYYYYAYNGGGYQRLPASPQEFLSPTPDPVPFDVFVDNIVKYTPYPISILDLVLWGWEGGSPVNLGSWHILVDRSDLTICNRGTNCTGDMGQSYRSTYGEIASNVEDQLREFYWVSTAPGTTAVLWQISTQPFLDNFQPNPFGLLASGCADGSGSGSFLVDFADLKSYHPGPAGCGSSQPAFEIVPRNLIENYLPKQIGMIYYARFTPMAGNQPSGDPSNTVRISYKPGFDTIEPVIEEHLPALFQVEITEFTPIKYADLEYWGCVSIESLDYELIKKSFRETLPTLFYSDEKVANYATELFDELQDVINKNQIVCPTAYEKKDDSSVLSEWGSSLMEGLNAFWEEVRNAYESLKSTAVNLAAGALTKLNIPCDTTCKQALRAGLEIGITYCTGIPPTLPSPEGLADEGINYAIQLAAAEAGIPCPELCQDALRSGLEEVVNMVYKSQSQPACIDAEWAHLNYKKNVFCFPDGVETKPVPEGLNSQAAAVVKITRPETTAGIPTPEYKYYEIPSYALRVRVFETNQQAAGKTYTYVYSYYQELFPTEENQEQLEINPELVENWLPSTSSLEKFTINVIPSEVAGQVFETHSIPVPPLAPGESVTIPMTFGRVPYHFDEHLAALFDELEARNLDLNDVAGPAGIRGAYSDWECLYNGGLIRVEAELYCLSVPTGVSGTTGPTEDSTLVPCEVEAVPLLHQVTSPPCQP